MATHDPSDRPLDVTLREALSMARSYTDIEHILVDAAQEIPGVPRALDGDRSPISAASFADPGGLSDSELKALIAKLAEREHTVSYERRILHGSIDLLRAELVTRLRQSYDRGD